MAVSHPTTLANSESIVRLYTDSIRSMYTMTGGQIRSRKGKLVADLLDAIVRRSCPPTWPHTHLDSARKI